MKKSDVVFNVVNHTAVGNSEKILYLKMFFKYGQKPFNSNFISLASEFNMNVNTVIKLMTQLRHAGLVHANPLYEKGGGRCGTTFQLKD